MDSAIIGISSFLASGAAIVIGSHIAITIGGLRSRPAAATPSAVAPVQPQAPVRPETAVYQITENFQTHRQAFARLGNRPYQL